MYNYNTFNGIPNIVHTDTSGERSIKYGDFVIHADDSDIRVQNIEFLDGKTIDYMTESFKNDGEIFNRRETIQTIKMTGSIRKPSRGDLLDYLDVWKLELSKEKQYLTVKEGEWSRRIRCTCTIRDLKEERYTVDRIVFSLEFKTFKYWQESEVQEVLLENITISPYSFWIARGGNAESKITSILAFTSATGVTQIRYSLGDTAVVINTTISATDNITIDGENQQVLKNGFPIGFIGEIPNLISATNEIVIEANGVFSYNLTSQYRKSFK